MNEGHLPCLLVRTSHLTMVLETLRALCGGGGVLLAAALLALLVDAVLAIGSGGRIAVDLVLLAGVVAAGVYAGWQITRNLFDPRRVARRIEERLDIHDNELINAVELSESADRATSSELRDKAVRDGEALAADLSSLDAVDSGRFFKMAGAAAGVALVVLVTFVISPRLFAMVLPRYLDPTGDHPPFTLIRFDVEVAPGKVYHGRPASITAKLDGPDLPDRANVVFPDGETRISLPMLRKTDGSFVLPIDRAEESREFYIDTPKGRSRRKTLTVWKIPAIDSAQVAYRFPGYTKWPDSKHALDSRGIRSIEGTEVILTAKSNLPLSSGELELFRLTGDTEQDDAEKQEDTPVIVKLLPHRDDVSQVTGRFPLEFSGRYKLTLIGVDGARSEEHLEGSLIAAPDRFPQVAIVQPPAQLIVVEDWEVPVVIQATDDVGVAKIELFAGINGWGPSRLELKTTWEQPTLARAEYVFDLAELGAQPGDIITYYASAHDGHPSGEHFTDTETYVIQVISREEYAQFARRQYEIDKLAGEFEGFLKQIEELKKQREELLKQMAPLQEKLKSGEELTGAEREELERLQKKMEEFQQAAEKLAEQLRKRAERPQIYDMEQPYQEMLKSLSEKLRQQSDNAADAGQKLQKLRKQPGNKQDREQLQKALERFREQNEPFDSESQEQLDGAQRDMEMFQKADELLAAAERLRQVVMEQRDLADRLQQFRDQQKLTPEEQRRADRLAKEQELLEQELSEAREQLEQAAKKCEGDLPQMSGDAKSICKAIGDMQIPGDQRNASRQARSGNGKQAAQSAEQAAQKLESLLSKMCNAQGTAGEMAGQMDGPLSLPKPSLEQTLRQMAMGRPGNMPGQKPGKTGRQGSGFRGSRARMTVLGPHMPSAGDSEAARQAMMAGRDGRGKPIIGGDPHDPLAAETLNPASATSGRSAAGNMRGVPIRYLDQAEAYFKRLAEESQASGGKR